MNQQGFYEERLAPIVCDLTQVVVSLGLISVSLGYVRVVIGDTPVLLTGDFWLRMLVLFTTVSFTCYSLLGYVADMTPREDTPFPTETRSPTRIIVLFLIDLIMLGEQGWLYGVLAVTVFDEAGNGGLSSFVLQPTHLVMLALLAAAWHATTFTWHLIASPRSQAQTSVWHLVASSRLKAQASHLGFFAAFVLLAGWAFWGQPESPLLQWLWTLAYMLVVVLLFFIRGRSLVRKALIRYDQTSTT